MTAVRQGTCIWMELSIAVLVTCPLEVDYFPFTIQLHLKGGRETDTKERVAGFNCISYYQRW